MMIANPLLSKTFCFMVTCCVEQTRKDVLDVVVANLIEEQARAGSLDIAVFDNGSTVAGTRELLANNFDNVYFASQNKGYWSAIDWMMENVDMQRYEYLYVIESDNLHYQIERLVKCEKLLDTHPHIGSVRVQEFDVTNRHLYDKMNPSPASRRHAWFTQVNRTTGKPVDFVPIANTEGFYETQLSTFVCSVNRLDAMQRVFARLRERQSFLETDFQSEYHKLYLTTAQLDGGVFRSNVIGDTSMLAGSWVPDNHIAYFQTRKDAIRPYESVEHVARKM